MKELRRIAAKSCTFLFFAFVFVMFFNGYAGEGPAKKKFKKLGESGETIDLTKEDTTPEVDLLKGIEKDKRLKEWTAWWQQKCAPGFSVGNMEDIGLAPIYDEDIPPLTPAQMDEGPAKMFYSRSPDGKRWLNPWNERLVFKKEAEGWQPYIERPCSVALYTPAQSRAKNILDCSVFEGIDDAFWSGKERVVLMGYSSVTRHMNVECETLESCVAPTIWIVDLKSNSISEHHGPLVKREKCELGGYLKVRLPDFFHEDKK